MHSSKQSVVSFAAIVVAGILYNFNSHAGVNLTTLVPLSNAFGSHSTSGLVRAADSNFYGVAYNGGISNNGTIYRLTTTGAYTNIAMFNGANGANPYAGLTPGIDGNLYGTTEQGGTNGGFGTVFRVTTGGTMTTLISFNGTNGANPMGELVQGPDGSLFGSASSGGANGFGTIFKITTNGALNTLFTFSNTNGAYPLGSLTLDANGSLFGTTSSGGSGGSGTVYQLGTNGVLNTLVSFNGPNGGSPAAGLIIGLDGNLYGTTSSGGNGESGTIFRVSPLGAFTSLASFNNTNGAIPYAPLLQGTDGNFYGTTEIGGTNGGYGTIFQVTPNGVLNSLVSFNFANGDLPMSGLTPGADGNYYGTTHSGGMNAGGTIFKVGIPMSPLFKSVTQTGATLNFTYSAVSGQMYQLQFVTDLGQTNWSNLGGAVTATNSVMSGSTGIGPDAKRFYHMQVLP